MISAKRVLLYLKGTSSLAQQLSGPYNSALTVYCDSDWAGDRKVRKSAFRLLFIFNGAPVMCKTVKQYFEALYSSEEEFIALLDTIQWAVCLRALMTDFD